MYNREEDGDWLYQDKAGDISPIDREKLIAAMKEISQRVIPYYPASVRMNPETRSLVKVNESGEFRIWDSPFSDCSFRIIYDPRVPVGGLVFCNNDGVPIPPEKVMEYGIPQGENEQKREEGDQTTVTEVNSIGITVEKPADNYTVNGEPGVEVSIKEYSDDPDVMKLTNIPTADFMIVPKKKKRRMKIKKFEWQGRNGNKCG